MKRKKVKTTTLDNYDKEKYREMILDAAETFWDTLALIELFTVISKRKKGRKWYEELREERTRDIQTETMEQ